MNYKKWLEEEIDDVIDVQVKELHKGSHLGYIYLQGVRLGLTNALKKFKGKKK